nr:MAG TPA: Sarcoplasmic/endoplasmic reticulum calcium ATPase 1-ATPase, SERCA1a, membrane protein.51A [Caudoviricetes sp.]DAI25504.1 MAG TPA: Sarcoplasmic/endoplasmic reticulum calcium ATPase 1-ATPase, SERCA1a, membrane protein.51A [Caudoviricetes sp.]
MTQQRRYLMEYLIAFDISLVLICVLVIVTKKSFK